MQALFDNANIFVGSVVVVVAFFFLCLFVFFNPL